MIKEFLDYELKDDSKPWGGVAFFGETVADFVDEHNNNVRFDKEEELLNLHDDIKELNNLLKLAGIKPIRKRGRK